MTNSEINKTPKGFVSGKQSFKYNLSRRDDLVACLDKPLVNWAERLGRFAFLPYAIDDVFVQGYEHFPLRTDEAPVIAIAHKKLSDVFAALTFMAGRPIERFHDITLVAQAGLFYGIYSYRDLVPTFLKRQPMIPLLAGLSRLSGHLTKQFVHSLHANPVFREGVDLPSELDYYDRRFAGEYIMKMNYDEFVRHAGRTTASSVVTAQKELIQMNRAFVIFPEGKYCHDGAIAEMQDLVGVVSYRKSRPIISASLTYDELCQDKFGRTTGWVKIMPPVQPPRSKAEIPKTLHELRQTLQENSIVTASHLIATTLQKFRNREKPTFEWQEFLDRYNRSVSAAIESGFSFDVRLKEQSFRDRQLGRFMRRKGKRWLLKNKRKFSFREDELAQFASTERTVDDLVWNANNIRHLKLLK